MSKKLSFIVFSVLSLSLPFAAVHAQAADCEIDVQPIVATLIQAQTAAASGNQDEALQQIADAKAALEVLKTNCTAEPLPPPDLTTTFTAPDESFTFNYPEGWAADEFTPTLDDFGSGGRAIIADTEAGLELLTQSIDQTKLAPTDQAAMIIVGSPSTVLYSLGIYDATVEQPNIPDAEALTEYILLAIRDGQVFDEISDPVYEGQNARFSIGNPEFVGVVLLTQLDTDKYTFTLLIGDTGTRTTVNTLAEAIHATVK